MMACYGRVSTRRQKADSQKADIQRWLTGHAVPPQPSNGSKMWTVAPPSSGRPLTTCSKAFLWARSPPWWSGNSTGFRRRQREGINLLAEWCERGVRVVVITQQLDLSGAVGRLVAGVLFGLAEIEHEYRQERQAAGLPWPSGKAAITAGPRDDEKPSRPAPGSCMTVASPWWRL